MQILRDIQSIRVAIRSSLNVFDVFISLVRKPVKRVDTTCGNASILMAFISPSKAVVARSLSCTFSIHATCALRVATDICEIMKMKTIQSISIKKQMVSYEIRRIKTHLVQERWEQGRLDIVVSLAASMQLISR